MSPFELVATPAASPRWMFAGSVSGVGGVVGNLREVQLRGQRAAEGDARPRASAIGKKASHGILPYRLDVVVVWRRRIFCTRQALISETISSSGLRQSMPCTVWNWPSALPALPNLPMIFPSSSIL